MRVRIRKNHNAVSVLWEVETKKWHQIRWRHAYTYEGVNSEQHAIKHARAMLDPLAIEVAIEAAKQGGES